MRVRWWVVVAAVGLAAAGLLVAFQRHQQPAGLGAVAVAAEPAGVRYERAEWPHWDTVLGCSVRERVLLAQGQQVRTGRGCTVLSGRWVSPYDGRVHTDPAALEVDHVVALHEAAQSGGAAWAAERKRQFANDEGNLLVVTAEVNQAKSDLDAGEWLPAQGRCEYARIVVVVKTHYGLSVDAAERAALAAVLAGCA